jgi:Xaa-Pro dipeptidase
MMSLKITHIKEKPDGKELQSRIDSLRLRMISEGLDYYVCANTENVYYLTNFSYIPFERPFFLVIPAAGKPAMVTPGLEISHAQDRVLLDVEYHTYYEFPAPDGRTYVDALKKIIPDGASVGIESSITVALKGVMPGKLKAVDIIDDVRMVKSEYEVGRIAHACSITETGMKTALELSRPGAQQLAVYSEGTRQMLARILFEIPNPNILVSKAVCAVWPGKLSAQPHSMPGLFDQFAEGGPNVVIIAAQADGYSAELERTFFIGSVPDAARDPYDAMMEARTQAFNLVRPGIPAAEVDRKVLKVIEDRGYKDYILHRTGHGFGITGHEPPWVALGSETILKKNMIISIEPGIYIPGLGGFRHSDTVLVTEDGCVSLTNWPDSLEDLTLTLN